MCVSVSVCRCPQRPVDGARYPCAGVPGGCVFQIWAVGPEPWSPVKVVSSLSH